MQSQKAVTAYFPSKQILPVDFTGPSGGVEENGDEGMAKWWMPQTSWREIIARSGETIRNVTGGVRILILSAGRDYGEMNESRMRGVYPE